MSDQLPQEEAEGQPLQGTPLWVKLSGLVAVVVVALFLVVLLIGGGHGPGRHTLGDDPLVAVHALPLR